MKFFDVELKRVAYVTLQIEAKDAEHAEQLAWEELQSGESYGFNDADWSCESITQQEFATDETRSFGPKGATA
jgi:hypothetical protein